ncbi:tripartite tricarboxylate transporter substrate binding protein [Pikeienuella sp. HZG-20]|uniref:tripartite tricarboxylate transporter substrate binding protein n=1 Tax=Paludibacillus litoralis TaxID=3133267 RepID=UPI0030ED3869
MLKRHRFGAVAALALGGLAAVAAFPAQAEYPERPITLIVPWGAGGGTDATGRMIAALLEEDLGQPVNVVNRTGGSGVVGHSAIANAKPDGYTIGVVTVEIGMMHWTGLTELTSEDYTPLVVYNFDPAGLQVREDSPWKTAQDVLDAVKADPGAHKASGVGQGGIWHLAMAGLLESADIAPDAAPWVPSQGAAPGLQSLVSGGVDIVPCSLPEAESLISAGKVRSLAIMSAERLEKFPDIPTLKEATGLDWTMGGWRSISGPKDMPQDVVDRLIPALERVYNSGEFREFMSNRGFGLAWAAGDDAAKWMADSDATLGKVMAAVGMTKE